MSSRNPVSRRAGCWLTVLVTTSVSSYCGPVSYSIVYTHTHSEVKVYDNTIVYIMYIISLECLLSSLSAKVQFDCYTIDGVYYC